MGVFTWEGWFELAMPSKWSAVRDDYFVSISNWNPYGCVLQASCHELEGAEGSIEDMLARELRDAADAAGFRLSALPSKIELDGRACVCAQGRKGRRYARIWAAGEKDWHVLLTLTYGLYSPGVETGAEMIKGLRFLR